MNEKFILPIGTQIVTHIDIENSAGNVIFVAGAVGIIVKNPVDLTHVYRIRFMDGTEYAMKREHFSVRSQHQDVSVPDEHLGDVNLYQYVIYRCVVGSRAYGLDHADSDIDMRGIYVPPANYHWSLFGVPEQLERGEEAYWEVQKFIILALKANPNILECLYTPLVEEVTPIAQDLLVNRNMFLSKLIYQTYNGYVMSQFKKLQKDLENHGQIRWKHAMHLIRLLLAGIDALNNHAITVRVNPAYKQRLLDIRYGQEVWENINTWRLVLHKEFEIAFKETTLPDRPDYVRANDYLIQARTYGTTL